MDLKQLLAQAAAVAVETGVTLDSFADSAWQAWLEAKPGLREELEARALLAQLGTLRERGLVGSA